MDAHPHSSKDSNPHPFILSFSLTSSNKMLKPGRVILLCGSQAQSSKLHQSNVYISVNLSIFFDLVSAVKLIAYLDQ